MFVGFPVSCFVLTLVTDLAYWNTASYLWETISVWLLAVGLFGAGIAFPERVIDRKYGHEEMNVGFFKFMKAVKKWIGEWKAVPGQV